MKNSCLLPLALLIAATTALAQTPDPTASRVDFYAQAAAVLALPGDFEKTVGGAVALGMSLHQVHAIEIEAIRFTSSDGGDDVKFTPMLATYKYRLSLSSKLSVGLGGSVGATRESSLWYFYSHYSSGWWVPVHDTAFTYGATAGLSYAFNRKLSFDGNVKALRLDKSDLTTAGGIVLVSAGLNFRF